MYSAPGGPFTLPLTFHQKLHTRPPAFPLPKFLNSFSSLGLYVKMYTPSPVRIPFTHTHSQVKKIRCENHVLAFGEFQSGQWRRVCSLGKETQLPGVPSNSSPTLPSVTADLLLEGRRWAQNQRPEGTLCLPGWPVSTFWWFGKLQNQDEAEPCWNGWSWLCPRPCR